jgi:hypothetical protein
MAQQNLFNPSDTGEFYPGTFGFLWSSKAGCWYLPQPFANVTIDEERTRDNRTRYIFKIDGEVAYNGFLRYNKEAKEIFKKFRITQIKIV